MLEKLRLATHLVGSDARPCRRVLEFTRRTGGLWTCAPPWVRRATACPCRARGRACFWRKGVKSSVCPCKPDTTTTDTPAVQISSNSSYQDAVHKDVAHMEVDNLFKK